MSGVPAWTALRAQRNRNAERSFFIMDLGFTLWMPPEHAGFDFCSRVADPGTDAAPPATGVSDPGYSRSARGECRPEPELFRPAHAHGVVAADDAFARDARGRRLQAGEAVVNAGALRGGRAIEQM